MQAVHADAIPHRKIIRAWLEPVTRKNTAYALVLVAVDLAAFVLAITAAVLLPHPALQLLAAVLTGLVIGRLLYISRSVTVFKSILWLKTDFLPIL